MDLVTSKDSSLVGQLAPSSTLMVFECFSFLENGLRIVLRVYGRWRRHHGVRTVTGVYSGSIEIAVVKGSRSSRK